MFILHIHFSRPDTSFTWFMNPFKSLRYMIWEQYKFCLLKFLVVGMLIALMVLFFYSMPVSKIVLHQLFKKYFHIFYFSQLIFQCSHFFYNHNKAMFIKNSTLKKYLFFLHLGIHSQKDIRGVIFYTHSYLSGE